MCGTVAAHPSSATRLVHGLAQVKVGKYGRLMG
jgi:hypothetical protein